MTTTNATVEIRERRRDRMRSFISFFSIVLALYGLINAYIYIRLHQAVPEGSWFRPILPWIYWAVAASYFVGQYLERKSSNAISDTLTYIGAFWLGIMTWMLLACILVDLVRLIDHFAHFLPRSWYDDPVETKAWVGGIGTAFVMISMFLGFLNAKTVRVKPLTFNIDKPVPGIDSLHVAAISDIHMGTIIGRSMLTQMVNKINSIKPDLVLMAGDEVDGNPHPAMEQDLGSILHNIRSTYGVYAITGNHEYIGDVETACAYMSTHGIHMLRDTSVEIAGGIYLVGREDRSAKGFAHVDRKPLKDLVAPLDKSKPIIMMDHQPFHLEEAEQNGIDFQLSGHTHHAQMWPWSYITKAIYEVSWGYKRKGNTNVYVSCGAGTWGPPIRIGNTPEIMDITITFRKHQ